jgi:hypothetical protein
LTLNLKTQRAPTDTLRRTRSRQYRRGILAAHFQRQLELSGGCGGIALPVAVLPVKDGLTRGCATSTAARTAAMNNVQHARRQARRFAERPR